MKNPWIKSVLFVVLSAWMGLNAMAQESTSGAIAGKVSDPTGRPIAKAAIIATSEFGTRTTETDNGGNYILPFLKPGKYNLRAEAAGGFNTVVQNDVVVGLNQRTAINFTLEPGKVEKVTVTGAAPLVEVQSTSTGTNIKYEDFANSVPLGRSFTDTYAVAAGVVSGLGTGQGNYAIGGASGLENAYLIDGVNITNTGFGGIGAYNIVYGSLGTGVTSEFLDEVQIKTGGFEAEYGQALGGIINTIVKSGTNDFKGSVAWYSSPTGLWGPARLVELDSGAANRVDTVTNDFAFSVGGPIKKDKIFYFIAYNPVITTDFNRAQSLGNPAFGAAQAFTSFDPADTIFGTDPAGFPVADARAFPSAGRDLERRREANNYAVKLNWRVSDRQQLELTLFGDPARGERGPQRDNAPLYGDFATGGGESRISFGSNNATIKWNAVFGPRFFMEAQVGRHFGKFRETSARNEYNYVDLRNNLEFRRGASFYTDPNTSVQEPFTPSPVISRQGGVGFITQQDDKNTQYQVKLTSIAGKHELKYGVQYDDIEYRENATYTGPSFNVQLPVSYYDPMTRTVETVDEVDNATGVPGPDGIQDFIAVPSRSGALVNIRNGVGDPAEAFDSANRFRVTRARLGPELPFSKAEELNFFIQDTWTILPRLTLKLGARYTEEKINGAGSFDLGFGTQAVEDQISPGVFIPTRIFTAGTSAYRPDSYNFAGNLAPRIGLSWDVQGNGKSRLYVNYGRYYERVPSDLAVRAFSNEVGISRQEFTRRDLTDPRTSGSSPQCVDTTGVPTSVDCATSAPVFTQGVDQTAVVGGVKLPYEDEISGGYAFEITPSSAFEVRAIFRTQGRVLEDTQVNSVEAIQNFYYGTAYGYPYDPFGGSAGQPNSPTFPARVFGTYFLANPGTRAIPPGLQVGTDFPKPERDYKALELVYTKRFSNRWSLNANYRLSRLTGNYEGLFRNDNGQSDPNITSLYDFPNSPLMAGQFIKGPLPSDVRNVLHIYPSYLFPFKLRVGANLTWASGVPRTSLLAHPSYQNSGEIPGIDPVYAYWADLGSPNCPSGATTDPCLATTASLPDALSDPGNVIQTVFLYSYTPVKRGNLGRTPDIYTFDLHADYPIQTGKAMLRLMLDVFNVPGTRRATAFDDNIELTAGVTDPDFKKPIAFQTPRSWRLAARWEF